jgi:hypothetical protein
MPRRAQDFNFEVADIESVTVGKLVISVSKMRFLAMAYFCVGLPLQVERTGHEIFIAVRFKDVFDFGAFSDC